MPRQRSPNRDKAKQLWIASGKKRMLKDIAKELDVSEEQIRKWKSQDKWDGISKVTLPKKNSNVTKEKMSPKQEKKQIKILDLDKVELTEKQKLFCLYYIKSFNATMSAIKAGYAYDSAHAEGSRLLKNVKIAEEIRRLKGAMADELFVDAMDVLNKYIKIAFADMNDFVEFGSELEYYKDGNGKKELDEEGNPKTYKISHLYFKNNNEVDGTLICEIKTGRQGMSLKLEDRQKALDKLALYFDLFPDKFKRIIEEEKLKLDKMKVLGEGQDNDQEGINSFIKATNMKEDEIKAMYEGDDDEQEEN